MPDATLNGVRVSYERAGHGPTLLLLHGIGSSHRAFRHQLTGLADSFDVVAWDAPGYGRSADPPRPFTLEELADDAVALLDTLGVSKAHVLGQSMGGVVAELIALRHPDRVLRLVLADTNPGSGSLPEPERSDRVRRRLEAIERQSPRSIAEARAPALLSSAAPPELVAEVTDIMAEIRAPGYRAAAVAMGTTDLSAALQRIAAPTLVLHGSEDRVIPLEVGRGLAAAIPGAHLVVLDGAGHASQQERPSAFNAAVRAFLTEDGGERDGSRSR